MPVQARPQCSPGGLTDEGRISGTWTFLPENNVPRSSAQSYDEVPFPNLPVPGSQPERLSTIAALRGMPPADLSRVRVLELGCASGQNIIPMAERLSGGTFLGIDYSAGQIAAARATARDLNLVNVEFRRLDIANLPPDLGTFDYIVAHAVYSWVDADTRDKLLAACRGQLAPHGIAFVSYNVYPGWHVHDMLRAMMLYDSRHARTTDERIAAARGLLHLLNDSLAKENPFTATIKVQLTQLMAQSNAYLLHDHLEEINEPVYYRHFVAHAARHALQPAGEGVLGIRFSDYLGSEAEERLSEITADPIEKEQYRDIVRNRSIRHTLLCHQNVELTRSLQPELLQGMYLSAQLKPQTPDVDPRSPELARFTAANDLRISTAVGFIKAALVHLGEIWPNYISFEDLIAASCERLEAGSSLSADEIRRLQDNLMQCCAGGIAAVNAGPQSFTTTVSDKPQASPLARWQAQRGDVATNRKHEAVRLEQFERHLLPLVDGQRDAGQLLDEMAASAEAGRFVVFDQQELVKDPVHARRALGIALPQSLARLAHNAFLVS